MAEVWNCLLEIAAPDRPVTVPWIPSHWGILGSGGKIGTLAFGIPILSNVQFEIWLDKGCRLWKTLDDHLLHLSIVIK